MVRVGRKAKGLTLFFATDIHGSEICFKKFLAAWDFYGSDVCILGGDMTGKMIVPLIERSPGQYVATVAGQTVEVSGADEVAGLESKIRDAGYYPYRTNPDELKHLQDHPEEVEAIFHSEMVATLRRWGEMADARFAGTDRRVYVAPGNDDPFAIDEVIEELPRFELIENRLVSLPDGREMIATGFSNRTPWRTHREVDEAELRKRIDGLAAQVTDMQRVIFNIHVPPYNCAIDVGPDIDPETWEQRTSMGHPITKPVGSLAVRDALEEHQPLLSLHGHIHESRGVVRIGRTLAVNPGSDYGDGVLRGCVVLLKGDRVVGHQLTSG